MRKPPAWSLIAVYHLHFGLYIIVKCTAVSLYPYRNSESLLRCLPFHIQRFHQSLKFPHFCDNATNTSVKPGLWLWHCSRAWFCFCFWHDHHDVGPEKVPERSSDVRDVQHRWPNSQVWPGSFCRSIKLDLGGHSTTIIWSGIPIWRVWPFLVRFRCYCSNPAVRHASYRT